MMCLRTCHLLVCLILPLVVGAAAPERDRTAAAPATQPAAEVRIDNFTFDPPILVVEPHTRVRWTNRDDVPHTVTSSDGQFKGSAALDTDDSFAMQFDHPGTYSYYCAVHPHMTAKVIVK